jgi:glucosyl-3-phosphoglycerate synthase
VSRFREAITILIPAHNERNRIGTVLREICSSTWEQPIEIIVIDDASTDGTGEVASGWQGVRVVRTKPASTGVSSDEPPGTGKGAAVSAGLEEASNDTVVTCDADLRTLNASRLIDLGLAIVEHPLISLAKANYPSSHSLDGYGGGRVTELVAKPLIEAFFPELSFIGSPLAGEMAFRKSAISTFHLELDYGFDIGLLIDTASRYGADSVSQIEFPAKQHKHHNLDRLSLQARQVTRTILDRAAKYGRSIGCAPELLNIRLSQLENSSPDTSETGANFLIPSRASRNAGQNC